jgi:hypothetical protein
VPQHYAAVTDIHETQAFTSECSAVKRQGNARSFVLFAGVAGILLAPAARAQSAPDDDGPVATATLSVKGSDLIIGTNQYTGKPDQFGGFQIGIKLPQHDITVKNCNLDGIDGTLAITMGDVTPDNPDAPSPQDKALIKEKQDYYDKLLNLSKSDAEIDIKLQGSAAYLQKSGGKLVFPYCSSGFSGFGD